MFKPVDEKFIKRCFTEGSLLKKSRAIGGVGAGLMAAGAMFVFIGIVFAVMGAANANATGEEWMLRMSLMVCGALVVASLPFIAGGMALKKRRVARYMDYFVKKTGYSREELESFEQESRGSGARYYLYSGRLQSNSALFCSFSTENWLKMGFFLTRMKDIAAVFYEKQPYYKGNKMDDSIFFVRTDGELYHMNLKEKAAQIVIDEVRDHNPAVITMRKIMVQGQPLDCMQQPEEAARLYCQATGN